jgi:hypothetical protein
LQHIQECHVNPCQYCTRIFKTCQALIQHTHASHWFKYIYCTTNTFTSQSLLEIHIGEQHTFTSQFCSLVFRREAELQKHTTQHAQSCKFRSNHIYSGIYDLELNYVRCIDVKNISVIPKTNLFSSSSSSSSSSYWS